ncbi:MAG: hypothetical protein BWX79_02379 [Alphaproteobacteria bacterium ADurb.Bin100]|nr:MAG: hypothetical protein BWX79_02379 [Alphaproteobacteria bacterium ADurb.Bin100]
MALTYISGTTTVQLKDTQRNSLDLSVITDALSKSWAQTWVAGTTANAVQVNWHDKITLTSGQATILDLNNTSTGTDAVAMNNGFGNLQLTKVKKVFLKLETATAGYSLDIGGGNTPLALDAVSVGAGGMFLVTNPVDGITVEDATSDLLLISNPSAGAVVFDICIAGVGAIA